MITPDSVIDALGGTAKVATALSVSKPAVSCWRKRGIPSTRWRPLSQLAEACGVPGITLDSLERISARPSEEARP